MRRGGHDPEKVYAAYKMATELKNGRPTVILAKTIKGYGLGEVGEGKNIAHNKKKANEDELREFRSRFGIPISDEEVAEAPFYKPPEDSVEMNYLRARREELGGSVPSRPTKVPTMEVPTLDELSRVSRWQQRPRNVHDDGCRAFDEQTVQRQTELASTSFQSSLMNRGRSAWKACSSRSASMHMRVNCTNRSILIS